MSRDTCKACGHARVFHQIGRGAGVPAGSPYCDDRYSEPCECSAFVEEGVPIEEAVPDKIQTVLSPELDLTLCRDKIQTVLSPELDLTLCRELVSRAWMGEKLGSE